MAGVDNNLRVIYIYEQLPPYHTIKYSINSLEKEATYKAYFWSPTFESKITIDNIQSDNKGRLKLPTPPSLDEWVLVMSLKTLQQNRNQNPINPILKRVKNFFKQYSK